MGSKKSISTGRMFASRGESEEHAEDIPVDLGDLPIVVSTRSAQTSLNDFGLVEGEESDEWVLSTKKGTQSRDESLAPQSTDHQSPVNNISRIYLQDLGDESLVDSILVDNIHPEREYDLYVVINEESFDFRMEVIETTKKAREMHPLWDITPHIIARDTDPELEQIPDSAVPAGVLVESTAKSQFGHAF